MKKFISLTFSLMLILILPLFAGCSNGSLPKINMSVYYQSTCTANIAYSSTAAAKSISLDTLTNQKSDTSKMAKYLDFTINGNISYLYKMYIQKIEFYVLTNQDAEQMTFNLSVTNLAKESSISDYDTFTEMKSYNIKGYQVQKCSFEINQVVVSSAETSIKIDLSESSELLTSKTDGQENTFVWMLYGLQVYGESREYSR